MDWIKEIAQESSDIKAKIAGDDEVLGKINEMIEMVRTAFNDGNKIILCGNGGSTCDAMHIAEEFTGRFDADRKPYPAISLSDAAHITCTANDYGFDAIFSRGVEAYGKPGDILIGLSTSGNSTNVVRALEKAKILKMKTIGFTGESGGKLAEYCDILIKVPSTNTARIQEAHIMFGHMLLRGIEMG